MHHLLNELLPRIYHIEIPADVVTYGVIIAFLTFWVINEMFWISQIGGCAIYANFAEKLSLKRNEMNLWAIAI